MKTLPFVLTLTMAIAAVQAEQVIKDGFDLVSESKVPLAAAVTETGDRVWEATPNVVVIKDGSGGVVSLTDGKSFGFRLPVPSESELITLEAQVHPASSTNGDQWIAVGIGNTPINTKNLNVAWAQGVFLLLGANGRYQCLFNATTSPTGAAQIQGGPAPAYKAEGMNRIKIEYRRAENKVSMWVNDQKILGGYNLEKRGFTPNPAYAGVTGFGQTPDQQSVDNVVLTLQP